MTAWESVPVVVRYAAYLCSAVVVGYAALLVVGFVGYWLCGIRDRRAWRKFKRDVDARHEAERAAGRRGPIRFNSDRGKP